MGLQKHESTDSMALAMVQTWLDRYACLDREHRKNGPIRQEGEREAVVNCSQCYLM